MGLILPEHARVGAFLTSLTVPYLVGLPPPLHAGRLRKLLRAADRAPQICRQPCGLADEAVYRRQVRMEETVSRAQAVFAPSEFQAALVRRHFVRYGPVRTNRNGILLPDAPRPPEPRGRCAWPISAASPATGAIFSWPEPCVVCKATIFTALHQRGKSHPPRLFPTRPFFSVFRTLDRTIFQPERSGQCLSRHQAGHYARMPNALGRGLLHGHRYGLLA